MRTGMGAEGEEEEEEEWGELGRCWSVDVVPATEEARVLNISRERKRAESRDSKQRRRILCPKVEP